MIPARTRSRRGAGEHLSSEQHTYADLLSPPSTIGEREAAAVRKSMVPRDNRRRQSIGEPEEHFTSQKSTFLDLLSPRISTEELEAAAARKKLLIKEKVDRELKNKTWHTIFIMGDITKVIEAFARTWGLPVAEILKFIENLEAVKAETTARETANRTTAEPRPADLTTARIMAAYEILVRESDLMNPVLSEAERLRRAGNLISTYNRLRKHDPEFHDNNDQLRAARRIRMARFRRSKKARLEAGQTAQI